MLQTSPPQLQRQTPLLILQVFWRQEGREHFIETSALQFYIMQYNMLANGCHVWYLNICAEK